LSTFEFDRKYLGNGPIQQKSETLLLRPGQKQTLYWVIKPLFDLFLLLKSSAKA